MSADQEATGLTIARAAQRLGVSENAVRQRIKRGTIAAAKVDGVWRVTLPEPGFDQEAGRSADHQGDRETDRYADQEATTRVPMVSDAARAQLAAIRDEFVAPLVDRIGSLERENGRLEAERDQAARQRDELRAQVERLRAEEASRTQPEPPGAAERPEPASGPRRCVPPSEYLASAPWWRRLWRRVTERA